MSDTGEQKVIGTTTSDVTVVICTCDRGRQVVATVESALANTYPEFQVLVIDQSRTDETAVAVEPLCVDPRFRYIHSSRRGKGRAQNLALDQAKSDIIAFTDDDCVVPPDWIEKNVRIFRQQPRVAVVFSNVAPAPHDANAGFIPSYVRQQSQLVRTMWDKSLAWGLGASMAVRRAAILEMGGFDEQLGPGSRFPSADDEDIAIRALLHNWWVYESSEITVIHDGFRTWEEGIALTRRDWLALGAVYAKPLKCGHGRVAIAALYKGVILGLIKPFAPLFSLQRPQGFRRFFYFAEGFMRAWQTAVNRHHILFKDDGQV
jgi:GT2 family glycosyltransferase